MSDLLSHPSFVRFWCARVAAVAGTQMLMLTIGWHMYELTASAWDLGLVGLFQFAPALAMTLPAGHTADRHHRARIVALCLSAQAMVALLLVAGTLAHAVSREWLLALSALLGAIRPFQMSAQQALLPSLVPAPLLARATAVTSTGTQAAVIGGPALGGLIFAVNLNAVYIVCTVLFLGAALACLWVRYERQPVPREPVNAQTLLAGVRYVWGHPVLLGAVSLDLFAVLLGGATALLPIFAKEILHVGPEGLGLLRSAPAVGALAAGLVLSHVALERRVGRKLLVSVAVFGLCMVVFGLSTSFWLSLLALAVSGAADMVSVVIRQTLVQLETPDQMRGRVAAVNTLFIGASNQLGEFESGVTAAAFGPVGSVVLGGLGTIGISLAWWRLFRPLAMRDALAGPQRVA
ncbi:MFS transporter [Hydrogenophaga pseudoflava]|uniref:Enterobactin exporter EntS n=1 Tax=Hydrogenophaga pseudoflava TaxID=47421 RepID=A0A4P6X5X5_HYDPS|nr:MFS transporter [Hydrogenophaga pseudoflava]QBM29968.1 Enterobactin exporter EntS [Hydrogenophaga pseudoflava]